MLSCMISHHVTRKILHMYAMHMCRKLITEFIFEFQEFFYFFKFKKKFLVFANLVYVCLLTIGNLKSGQSRKNVLKSNYYKSILFQMLNKCVMFCAYFFLRISSFICVLCNIILQGSQRHIRQQKPLSRTQSAPLPIMHPAAAALGLLPPQQQAILEHQELVKQHQEELNKQHQKKLVLGVS